jgi:hypothetical protein
LASELFAIEDKIESSLGDNVLEYEE